MSKICDQISDSILDELYKQDPYSRVAIECLTTTGLVVVAGEVTTKGYADIQTIVRRTLRDIGYIDPTYGIDCEDAGVLVSIHAQSPDISQGVNEAEAAGKESKEQGAGDQGLMYGYATNETPELMPLPIVLAHKLTMRLAEVRKKGVVDYIGPDGKSQVTVEYNDGKPTRLEAIVISTQHKDSADIDTIRRDMLEKVIQPVCGQMMDSNTKVHINPTGRFVIGGPEGDSGVTGRKIIVDSYGGVGRHGGGAFCISGDAMVNTEKGLVNIEQCWDVGKKGLLVKTDVHPMPAGAWYDNGVKSTEVIVTEDGYNVEATPNHNFRIIDSEGNYVWAPVEKLKQGDWICIQTKNRMFGNDEIQPFKYSYKDGTAEGRKKKYIFPEKLTEDYAYLLGLLIGDGLCTNEGDIRICVCEKEMENLVQAVAQRITGEQARIYGHWAYIGGVELRAYLKHIGLEYAKSYEKTAPKSVFNASKKTCAAFLRGLFDTDGSVRIDGRNKNTKRIHLATTSKKLGEQVQLLLLNFGIISNIRAVSMQDKKPGFIKGREIKSMRTRYDLTIKGSQSVKSFLENISFGLKRKKQILNAPIAEKTDRFIVPNQRHRIIKLFKKLPPEEQRKDICRIGRFTRSSGGKATKDLTYEKLREFVEAYEDLLKNDKDFVLLQSLFHMNHYYSRVRIKIPSFAHTYDLNIPFSHTFTANGFVCHNSGKDPTKVDRSGAYAARYVAKNIVAAGLADKCEVQVSYAIGVARPLAVNVDCFGTNKIPEAKIIELVSRHFDLRPKGIIDHLRLRRPIYRKTAAYGHFGRNDPDFTWEITDKAAILRSEALAVAAAY